MNAHAKAFSELLSGLAETPRKSHGGVWYVKRAHWDNPKYREEKQREADERGYRIIIDETPVTKIKKCIPLSHWMDLDYREKIIAWAEAEGVELIIDATIDKIAEGQVSDRDGGHLDLDAQDQWDQDHGAKNA